MVLASRNGQSPPYTPAARKVFFFLTILFFGRIERRSVGAGSKRTRVGEKIR